MINPQYLQFIQMMLQRQGMGTGAQAPQQQGLFNPQASRPMYRNYAGMFPQMAPVQQQTQAQTQTQSGMPEWYNNIPQAYRDRFPVTDPKNIPFPLRFLFNSNGQ